MKTPTAILGYSAAGATICAALLAPFLLFGTFTNFFAHLGLHVDEVYSGGPKVRTIQAAGYTIDVHRQVTPHLWQNEEPFVQLDLHPVSALPVHMDEQMDIDGDGQPDIRVSFDVPSEPKTPLHGNIVALNPKYQSATNVSRERFSKCIVRVDDTIIVRVPLAGKASTLRRSSGNFQIVE